MFADCEETEFAEKRETDAMVENAELSNSQQGREFTLPEGYRKMTLEEINQWTKYTWVWVDWVSIQHKQQHLNR